MGLLLSNPVLHLDDLTQADPDHVIEINLHSSNLTLQLGHPLTKPKSTLTISSLITADLILTTTWLEVIEPMI